MIVLHSKGDAFMKDIYFVSCKPIKYVQGIGVTSKIFHFDEENIAPSNQFFFCKADRTSDNKFFNTEEVGSLSFMRATQQNPYEQVLFYIHGFNVRPEDAMFQASVLQDVFDSKQKNLCQVIPIIWPCGTKEGIIRDYWDDQKSADMSGVAIGRAISMFVAWQQQNRRDDVPCRKYMNILAHSMGNRVLKEAIYHWGHYDSGRKIPSIFRNIFMVAADVVHSTLEPNQRGSYIPFAAKNIIAYYSGDDRALQGSKLINSEATNITKRLGHGGPTPASLAIPNVYGVDCDPVNSIYDPLLGHTYFVDKSAVDVTNVNNFSAKFGGKVFDHIFDKVKTGVMNDKKAVLSSTGVRGYLGSLLGTLLG